MRKRIKEDDNLHKLEKKVEDEVTEIIVTTGDLHEEIFLLEMNEPKDKRKKEYETWKKEINQKMKQFNKLLKWPCYRLIS